LIKFQLHLFAIYLLAGHIFYVGKIFIKMPFPEKHQSQLQFVVDYLLYSCVVFVGRIGNCTIATK